MQNVSERQSGGVLAFLLVGFVLAALLGGGIYVSKQQGRVASRTDTVAVNDTQTDDTATKTPQNDTAADDNAREATPAQPVAPAQPTTPATPAQPSRPAIGTTGSATVPTTGPSQIASTGVEDAIVPAVAVALTAAAVVSYRRSHVAVRTQALKR